MRKLLLASSFLFLAIPAEAEPYGRWWTGWGMGVTEYGYKSDSAGSDKIYIACSHDSTTISFSISGINPRPRSEVIVVIDGEELRLFSDVDGSIPTDSRVADANFRALWSLMRSGNTMWVRLSTGESARFPLKGSAKVLDAESCETDFAR